jgi:hypothetical protein
MEKISLNQLSHNQNSKSKVFLDKDRHNYMGPPVLKTFNDISIQK